MAEWGTRLLHFRLASIDYTGSVKTVRIRPGETDSDFVSFAEAAAGGARKYRLNIVAKQDNASSSLWYFAWSQPGSTVPYEVWPNGRPASGSATPTQPKFTGSVVVMEPDGDFIGGEADPSPTKFFTSEFDWDCTAKPVLGIS